MAVTNLKEKLAKLISTEPSGWMEEAIERAENRAWLKRSQGIAIKVLRTLREKGLSQKDLAASLSVSAQQVNKIVKGGENLTLETISKLENALGIQLIEVVNVQKYTDASKETITYSASTELVPDIKSPIPVYNTQENKPSLIRMEYDNAKDKYSYTKELAA